MTGTRALLSLLSVTVLAVTYLAFPVQAEDEQETAEKRPAVLEVNQRRIESLGLYDNPGDGSLGRDLWDNTRRSFLMEFIPRIPAPSKESFVHQRMVMGLLLSEANASLIENDIDFEPGKDLLTLRLKRLNKLGAYKQSFQLYSKLNQEPYHPELAKAGITAMLYNAERSLACLEYKTVEDRDFPEEFWSDLKLYCNYALSEGTDKEARSALRESSLKTLKNIAANNGYKVNYTPAKFKKLKDLERAILVAEDRVNWPEINKKFVSSLPANHLGILVAKPELENSRRFQVLAAAANIGLAGNAMLKTFYTRVYDEELRQLESPENLGWKDIVLAYQRTADTRKDTEKWDYMQTALAKLAQYGAGPLIPFGQFLQTMDPKDQNDSVIKQALKVIESSGENIPGKWVRHYTQKNPDNNFDHKLLLICQIMSRANEEEILQNTDLKDYFEKLEKRTRTQYFNIIENVDKRHKDIHNADAIYVNVSDLTFTERYVMPMPRVWNQLVNSSQDKRIGETVLLSTVILNQQTLKDMYPGVAGDILQSLNTVGLTSASKALALESVLD